MTFAPAGMTLIEQLGAGGVFDVALVRDGAGKIVVVKRIASDALGPEAETALARERDLLRAARGAPLPELLDFGTDALGGFLLETRALGSPARRLLDAPKRLDAARWLALARAACDALSTLHDWQDSRGALRIVHGDVSPDNLFFSEEGQATFIDLSSATYRDAPSPAFDGDIGTAPYSAPELLRVEAQSTQETDVYALAATLLALAVGPITKAPAAAARLWEAATTGVRIERLESRSDLPRAARDALSAALKLDPAERLNLAGALAERMSTG
ncbi:MAG TPA: phosphotransferase [Polyangiaceae bacterium]|jgi:serine/threonine-protein kinase